PFTLFNLGWTLLKQGRPAEAMPHLEKSLARSQPGDSVVRKIYALLVECHIRQGNSERALEVCRQGRRVCPDDAGILFEEGALHLEQGNLAAAEASFVALLERRAGTYFASVDPALYGHKSRHSLGSVYLKQGRLVQAEQQWQRALAERPDYTPTLLALGELYLEQGQWTKLDDMIAGLERVPGGKVESAILRAKGHMARKEFGPAKDLLEDAKQRFPTSLLPRVVLAHALLQEDRDVAGAEHALREVLAMDPHHGPTRHNLRVLMNRRGPEKAGIVPSLGLSAQMNEE
ncbi:MAG TPA: tetratricopeptide repeat protein, partial [Gemmataceae bacterium]|nr:tetratricopeptide repeat protein [Gemmataceae bacterium]